MATLNTLRAGDKARITAVNCESALRGRFYSFGVVKGASLEVTEITLARQTMDIIINKSKIALRISEAKRIDTEVIEKTSPANKTIPLEEMGNRTPVTHHKGGMLIRVALAGQPNVGKSSLINSISDARLRVGNFAGVTVEKKMVTFNYRNYTLEITDLPGSYSLNDYTPEERVTKEFLDRAQKYDIILNVADSTNLERNLYLTYELLSLDRKMLLALNMSDEADKEQIVIDEERLSGLLGIPCVKTSAAKRTGLEELVETVIRVFAEDLKPSKVIFSDLVEREIEKMTNFLAKANSPDLDKHNSYRASAIKILAGDKQIYEALHDKPVWAQLQPILDASWEKIYLKYNSRDIEDIFNDEKFSFCKGAITEVSISKKEERRSLSATLDILFLNKYIGLPIFLVLMWGLFQATFVIGQIPMEWIESGVTWLQNTTVQVLGENSLSDMISNGAIGGVGAVVSFIPNIMILFLGIALLETTGYMSRAAFLLDGFLHHFGLHGKSFIPLITGFGCSVPAYMAARTLKNRSDQLLTLFTVSFMSCGAKLPTYILFTGAFFSKESAGNALFGIYVGGAFIGLLSALVLKKTVFKGRNEPFVMEMPKYRMPSFQLVNSMVMNQTMMYFKKAGTYILAVSILVWAASSYPKQPHLDEAFNIQIAGYDHQIEQLQAQPESETAQVKLTELHAAKETLSNKHAEENLGNSYLGKIGKFSEPFFRPLGYDWKMAVALEAGLAAKEVVVSTLSVLYNMGDADETSMGLIENIRKNIPFPVAVSFIVFVMLYLPCVASSMVFVKESGGWKYLGYQFAYTTAVAWIFSFIAFHVTTLLT
ncbi:MAG: ferrous iron transport protein B [Desulforhopalus sp.]|nr:ferrous iron transport protein B [Desulforhopalus sp.]